MPRATSRYPPAAEDSGKILYPEVVDRHVVDPQVDPRIADVEAVARWMDYAFELPGGFRYGLGGLIGLIPGIGDIFDALLSLYIVSVPFIGAMFDTVFKANRRNYQLLKSHVSMPRRETAKDWWFLAITAVLALASVLVPLIVVIYLIKHL
jgi:Domain of unknown function (DUF4112)